MAESLTSHGRPVDPDAEAERLAERRKPPQWEIATTGTLTSVRLNGQILPVTSLNLEMRPAAIPKLTLELPVAAGVIVTLDGAQMSFGEITRAALRAAGWTPPEAGDGRQP